MRLVSSIEDLVLLLRTSCPRGGDPKFYTFWAFTQSLCGFETRCPHLWYVVSSTVGTKDLWVTLSIGDMVYDVAGTQLRVGILPCY